MMIDASVLLRSRKIVLLHSCPICFNNKKDTMKKMVLRK